MKHKTKIKENLKSKETSLAIYSETNVKRIWQYDRWLLQAHALDGEKIGHLTLFASKDQMELYDLFVKPCYRRQGLAKALVIKSKEIARENALTRLWLVATPEISEPISQQELIEVYKRMGFSIFQVNANGFPEMHLQIEPIT